jgi:hypothetical protein
MSQPSLRGRVVLKFPANVVAGPGITIDKTNSTYTFSVTGGGTGGGIGEAPVDGQIYGRQNAGWTIITGGTGGTSITNPLVIERGATAPIAIYGTVGGLNRWRLNLGDSEPETGVAGGSDFHLDSYNNDGSYRNLVIHADRDTSEVTLTSGPAPNHAILSLNKLASGQAATLQGKTAGALRWGLALGDGVSELPGGNSGSHFRINSYNDDGTFLNAPLHIERGTSRTMLTGGAFGTTPILAINKFVSGQSASIQGQTAGIVRWQLSLGDVLAETGTQSGSDFRINRYSNVGGFIDAPFWIRRDTGTLTLTGAHPAQEAFLAINKTSGGLANTIQGQTALSRRWDLVLGDGDAETDTATGSNLRIHRYNNAGTLIDVPLYIQRSTGISVFTGSPPDQQPVIIVNKTSGAGGQAAAIQGALNLSTRWHLGLGDGGAEVGGNSGSDFRLHRHADNGAFIEAALYIPRATGDMFVFHDAGKPTGALWTVTSDARSKTELGEYTQGLSAILALRPVRYKYNGKTVQYVDSNVQVLEGGQFKAESAQVQPNMTPESTTEYVGLIAQEAEVPMPEIVQKKKALLDGVLVDDYRVLDGNALIYALVNAVKELSARVEALEAAP